MNVGEKVVCVDDTPRANRWWRALPITKGRVYVIRGAAWIDDPNFNALGIWLIGITDIHVGYGDVPFGALRFRLLDDVKSEARERNQQEEPQAR